ncbi:MAG: hypothetical protein KatS3mg110_2769 [Pirellulaceae bacterium]|nr:MAG: hypothetical protein KatS3mg110_2769 [Pirellulaceae bacterium]
MKKRGWGSRAARVGCTKSATAILQWRGQAANRGQKPREPDPVGSRETAGGCPRAIGNMRGLSPNFAHGPPEAGPARSTPLASGAWLVPSHHHACQPGPSRHTIGPTSLGAHRTPLGSTSLNSHPTPQSRELGPSSQADEQMRPSVPSREGQPGGRVTATPDAWRQRSNDDGPAGGPRAKTQGT